MTKRKTRRGSRALAVATVLVTVWLVGVWGAGGWIAERTAITTVLAFVPQPFWLIPNVLVLLWALLARKGRWAAWNVGVLLVLGYVLLGLPRLGPVNRQSGPVLTVLTYNIRHGESSSWRQISEFITRQNPDIYCLQEASTWNQGKRAVVPGYYAFHTQGLSIGSKRPISHWSIIPLVEGRPPAVMAEIDGVRVVCTHMASFEFSDLMSARGLGRIPGHMHQVANVHERQVKAMLAHLRLGADRPTIIVGDFNGPPRGFAYQMLTRDYTDVFAAVGRGLGFSYPSDFPIHRIDYAFVRGMQPVSARVPATRLSDHRPLVVRFARN